MGWIDSIAQAIFTFTIFLIFATFHEYAHGRMAYHCGDSTALRMGRLSLNPLVHIDLIWTIILPVLLLISTGGRFAIGAARPVPVNTIWLRNPRKDMVMISLAGPGANTAWALFLIAVMKTGFFSPASPVYLLLFICMTINIILLVFNLLPIPPLDGSKAVEAMIPDKYNSEYSRIKPYMFIVLIVFMFTGILGRLLGYALYLVVKAFALQLPLRGI